jgi:hypothetical protein
MKNDDLSKLLRSWQPEVSEPADFARNVWRRIQLAQAPRRSSFQSWYEGVFIGLSRPRMAIAMVLVGAFAGVALGIDAAHSENAAGYLRSVNPYAQLAGVR